MTIGDRIKLKREEKDLSQRELARMANTSNASISRWETDSRDITADNIISICNALEVTPTWLLTYEQDEWKCDTIKHSTNDTLTLKELSDKFFSRNIPDNTSTIYVFKSEKDADNWIEHKYFKEHSMHDYSILMTIHSDFALKGIVQERWCNSEVEHFYAVEADTLVAVIDFEGDGNNGSR